MIFNVSPLTNQLGIGVIMNSSMLKAHAITKGLWVFGVTFTLLVLIYIYLPILWWVDDFSKRYNPPITTLILIFFGIFALALFAPSLKFMDWWTNSKKFKSGWLGKYFALLD